MSDDGDGGDDDDDDDDDGGVDDADDDDDGVAPSCASFFPLFSTCLQVHGQELLGRCVGPRRLHRHVAQREQPVRYRHVCILPGVPQLSAARKCVRSSKSEILAMTVVVVRGGGAWWWGRRRRR